jgi:hypothetical protein
MPQNLRIRLLESPENKEITPMIATMKFPVTWQRRTELVKASNAYIKGTRFLSMDIIESLI